MIIRDKYVPPTYYNNMMFFSLVCQTCTTNLIIVGEIIVLHLVTTNIQWGKSSLICAMDSKR